MLICTSVFRMYFDFLYLFVLCKSLMHSKEIFFLESLDTQFFSFIVYFDLSISKIPFFQWICFVFIWFCEQFLGGSSEIWVIKGAIGPPPYGGSYKIAFVCLSVCLSDRQFCVFRRNGSIVFSDFWHDGR